MTTQPLVDTPALDLDTALALDLDAGAGLDLGQKWPLEGLLNPAGAIPQNDRERPENRPGIGQR